MEPGRIHVAACDHALTWMRPPQAQGCQPMQIFASRVSFARELQLAGLADGNLVPQWNDRVELDRRLKGLDTKKLLPILTSLTQFGLVQVDGEAEGNLARMMEKADLSTIIEEFIGCGAEARVNWWDWSVSADAARMLVREYGDLIGSRMDFSMDVLEPATLSLRDWLERRPTRPPALWERAHSLFSEAGNSSATPLGRIGVADPGEGSIFADMGTLETLYEAYRRCLQEDDEGAAFRALFDVRLQAGSLIVGGRPARGVIIEPGAIVIDGKGIRSGRIGSGSIVISAELSKLVTSGRNIVYGVRAPSRSLAMEDGEVVAGVKRIGRMELVHGRIFELPAGGTDPTAWGQPRYGNAMSFADLRAAFMAAKRYRTQLITTGDRNGQAFGADQTKSL